MASPQIRENSITDPAKLNGSLSGIDSKNPSLDRRGTPASASSTPAPKRVKIEHQASLGDELANDAPIAAASHPLSKGNGNRSSVSLPSSQIQSPASAMAAPSHQPPFASSSPSAMFGVPIGGSSMTPSTQPPLLPTASQAENSDRSAAVRGSLVQASTPVATRDESQNDVDQLQDLLGMSGVDLRAEEEAIHGTLSHHTGAFGSMSANGSFAMARNAQHDHQQQSPFYLELYPLSHRIHKIAAHNDLEVDPDVLMFVSRATQMRFRNLLTSMVAASRHRQWSSHLRPPPTFRKNAAPMYHERIHDDPQKLLNALARAEKAEEQAARQLRMEREESDLRQAQSGRRDDEDKSASSPSQNADVPNNGTAHRATSAAASVNGKAEISGGADDSTKRKGKKPGVAAAARNMTEDKRLKLANNTAARALGITSNSKAWMFSGSTNLPGEATSTKGGSSAAGGGGPSRLPKPRFAAAPSENGGDKPQDARGRSEHGEMSVDDPEGRHDAVTVGGWGDLAARQRRKEEEERNRKRRVNLDDALHALEMERKGGAGRGSGERVLFATLAMGRPTVPHMDSTS